MSDTGDLFNPRRHDPMHYPQKRDNRTQVADDKDFYIYIHAKAYRAGAVGLSMTDLIEDGIVDGWWQDTARKHFGEKMRAAWAFGLIVLPETPGKAGTKGARIYHPAFFDVSINNREAQRRWSDIKRVIGDAD